MHPATPQRHSMTLQILGSRQMASDTARVPRSGGLLKVGDLLYLRYEGIIFDHASYSGRA